MNGPQTILRSPPWVNDAREIETNLRRSGALRRHEDVSCPDDSLAPCGRQAVCPPEEGSHGGRGADPANKHKENRGDRRR